LSLLQTPPLPATSLGWEQAVSTVWSLAHHPWCATSRRSGSVLLRSTRAVRPRPHARARGLGSRPAPALDLL